MALKLYYKELGSFVEISTGGDMDSPLSTVHDGKTGEDVSVQLFVRNDDENKWYSNIEVFPFDKSVGAVNSGDVNYEDTGWGVKLSLGSVEPSAATWEDVDWGGSILISNIGSSGSADTTQYHPFWCLLSCPPHHSAVTKENISFRVEYTENAV